MRNKKQKITDRTVIEEILRESRVCRIGINDAEAPYIVPFNYGYNQNCIYMHCAKEGKKIDLLKKNNRVCFEIEEKAEVVPGAGACDWATLYRSVIGYGNIELIDDADRKKEGLKIIMSHYGTSKAYFNKKNFEEVFVLKLTIDKITGKQSSNWNKLNPVSGG